MHKQFWWVMAGALALTVSALSPGYAAGAVLNTPLAVQAYPGTGAVLLTYGTVGNAVGYNIYRHEAGKTDAPALVNAQPDPYGWLIDDGAGKGLPNGTHYLYSVKAVNPDKSEGPASAEVEVAPQVPLGGLFFAYDIGTKNPSTVSLSADKKVLTVKASGGELWDANDSGTFIGTAIAGDYSVSAVVMDHPAIQAGGKTSAKAGVIIREDVAQFARNAYLFASNTRDPEFLFEGRQGIPGQDSTTFSAGKTNDAAAKFPVWLKLTKVGSAITGLQSNDGTNYTNVIDDPQIFPQLAPVTYAGIEVTALADGQYVEAHFDATYGSSGIKIE